MEELFENWAGTKDVLLEGLEGSKREITAFGLESTRKFLTEAATAGSTAAGNIGDFRKILMPLVRRTLPNQIASEIVGVQPMSGPVGLVYSLRFRYRDAFAADGTRLASPANDVADGDEMFSPTSLASHYSGANTGEAAVTAAMEGVAGNRVDLQVLKQAVEAKTRKLSARWTIESMQDLQSQHGLDVEAELVAALSAEITAEMDQEIILDLANLAGTTAAYDQTAVATAYPNAHYVGDRHQALSSLIAFVSTEIARKTKRGGATFMIVSHGVLAAMQSANMDGDFRGSFMHMDAGAMVSGGKQDSMQMVGVLNGGIKVYLDQYNIAGNNTIIMGYKGPNEVDTGYFHCPYVPLVASQPITDPNTFEPVIQLMTRYGKATFTDANISLGNSSSYYAKITVANLAFV